jgi:hypothetical protein
MTPSEVLQTVLALMKRTGTLQPSVVSLHDGSAIQAIPVGIQMQQPGDMQVRLIDVPANAERSVPAADIINIR